MTVGIPGTGIGGILYIMLCGWMMVCEGGRFLRGSSTCLMRRVVLRHFAIATGMLVSLLASVELLAFLAWRFGVITTLTGNPPSASRQWIGPVSITAVGAALIVIIGIAALMNLLRVVVAKSPAAADARPTKQMAEAGD